MQLSNVQSLMRPPVPVSAPANGAMPVGKLWVSAVKVMSSATVFVSSAQLWPGLVGSSARTSKPEIAPEADEHKTPPSVSAKQLLAVSMRLLFA